MAMVLNFFTPYQKVGDLNLARCESHFPILEQKHISSNTENKNE